MVEDSILVIPGTLWVVPLCKRIKELGKRVLLVDPNANCPCREFADEYLQADIFDWDKVIGFARKHNAKAVMSDECDIAMPMVSRIGEELGLCVQSSEKVKLFTDKSMMREFGRKNGFKYPEYRLCSSKDEAISFFQSIGRPIIIKPLDSNASHGVFKICAEADIERNFDCSRSFSRDRKAIIAERFIDGREFTIDGIKTSDRHFTLAVSKKTHFKHNHNIANELFFSYADSEFDYDELRRVNDEYIMASGLEYGFTHAEYKYEDGEFYLIEIACRGGGNKISSVITQFLSGYETYDYLIDAAMGNIRSEDFSIRDEFKERCAVLKFFDTPGRGGVVESVEGIDYLETTPDIVDYQLNFKLGDRITEAENDSVRIGYYIACADNRENLDREINEIDRRFRISIVP